MFGARHKGPTERPAARPAPERPARAAEVAIPDVPSLEGYTIAELRTSELARLIRFEELQPEQVAHLIRTLTRGNR
jgi:hypothetical protein